MEKLIELEFLMSTQMHSNLSKECLYQKIDNFKSSNNASSIITNYYIQSNNRIIILLEESRYGLFFLLKDEVRNLSNYYFIALKGYLNITKFKFPPENIVFEYVYNIQENIDVINHMEKLGFLKYNSLTKMSLIERDCNFIESHDNVVKCNLSDFKEIKYAINNFFDPISERLPDDTDIISAIKSGSCFKVIVNNKLVAFYWANTKSKTSELRFVFVNEKFRARGLGKTLINHHLQLTSHVMKNQLWVLDNNYSAIKMYKNFGYKFEKIHDLVFLRKHNEKEN
jgi:GNAT superfamily N-acetyltransferase